MSFFGQFFKQEDEEPETEEHPGSIKAALCPHGHIVVGTLMPQGWVFPHVTLEEAKQLRADLDRCIRQVEARGPDLEQIPKEEHQSSKQEEYFLQVHPQARWN